MIKLYKAGEPVQYWEAWATPTEVTIHWGVLGEAGETREIRLSPGDNPNTLIDCEAKKHKKKGFKKIPRSKLQRLIIQYQIEGMGQETDRDKRIKVEGMMNESLGWRGLGHCDGGDIGSGTMNVFCFVADTEAAVRHVLEALKTNDLLTGVVIAIGDQRKVVWPKNFKGNFEI